MRAPAIPPAKIDADLRPLYDDMRQGIERSFKRTATAAIRQNSEAEPDLEDRYTCCPEVRGQLQVQPSRQQRDGQTLHQRGNDIRIEQDQGSNLAG